MNIKTLPVLAGALAALTLAAPQQAQSQVSLEVRGSLQKPVGDFADVADGEAGFGADVFFNVNPRVSVYGGYGIENFGCDGCGEDDGYTSRGFEAGAKFIFTRNAGVLPWARLGATFHELELETNAVSLTSDRKVGFQAALGADIPLGDVLSFSPALRYQAFNPDFGTAGNENVGFLAVDFGLHIHPGR